MVAIDWDWSRVVIDHVALSVRDADETKRFYETVLDPLGVPAIWTHETGGQFANLVYTSKKPDPGGTVHLAFVAASRDQVDAFHRAGVEAGFADNGPPGVRDQYSSDEGGRYYAAFLLDPDGNNVEAVHREF